MVVSSMAFAYDLRGRLEVATVTMVCSPNPDPSVMRVFGSGMGQEILDECKSQEASFGGSNYLGVA